MGETNSDKSHSRIFTRDGDFQFSKDYRVFAIHFKLSYPERSLLREIHEKRATSDYTITHDDGRSIDIPEKCILISERRWATLTGHPRSTLQRMLRKFARRGLLRRIELKPTEGVLFRVVEPQEHPELRAMQVSLLGHLPELNSSNNIHELRTTSRTARTTLGHSMGHQKESKKPLKGVVINTRNAAGEPPNGPHKKNAYNNLKKKNETQSVSALTPLDFSLSIFGGSPSAGTNAALDGPQVISDGPNGTVGDKGSPSASQAPTEALKTEDAAFAAAGDKGLEISGPYAEHVLRAIRGAAKLREATHEATS